MPYIGESKQSVAMTESEPFSVAILAGGKARRMGKDKAFLTYNGKEFIRIISDEMLKVSDEVLVVVGEKDTLLFSQKLDRRVKLMRDTTNLENPMGGILSACTEIKNEYSAFVACDTPMIVARVVSYLSRRALGHSAAVPIWTTGNTEPLCGVYNVKETEVAGERAIMEGKIGCNNLLSFMKDVSYVPVEELLEYDPELKSLRNINTSEDLKYLV